MARTLNIGPLSLELRRRVRENLAPLHRDPQRALDGIRAPGLQGDGLRPSAKFAAFLADARQDPGGPTSPSEKVESLSWYHTIELPGGIVTKGSHDHRPIVAKIGLPSDLSGRRALDVATFDGFWAFEMERRGAEVVALDLPSVAGLDWPPEVARIVANEGLDLPFGEPFSVAAEALGSKVGRLALSVYDLDPETTGTFDLVHSGDLLLHLAAPVVALQRMRSVTRGQAIIVDRFDPELRGLVVAYRGGWSGLEWWAPSLDTLVQWVADAGFSRVKVHDSYEIPNRYGEGPGWSRAVIHAHAQ